MIGQGIRGELRIRDLLALEDRDFRRYDIAHALALTNRFGGQAFFPYSVAQHSVLVSELCPPELALVGLLHDVTEAFGIGDLIGPVKCECPDYRRIEAAIFEQCQVRFPCLAREVEVKVYDRQAYAIESFVLRGWMPPDGPRVTPREIHEMDWWRARDLFLKRWEELEPSNA